MPMHLLGDDVSFPPTSATTPEGVIAVGDDLRVERLLAAYSRGIFPWPVRGFPLLWFCPDPRFVLPLDSLHVGRSTRRAIRRGTFEVRFDTAFSEVIDHCAHAPRKDQDGTWITPALRNAFVRLHQLGFAHSIEAWCGDELAGGLYGVSIGTGFFGESMFARRPDASKVAFVTLAAHLRTWNFDFVDCQVETDHLARFGAHDWPRERFMEAVRRSTAQPTRKGLWTAQLSAEEVLGQIRATRPRSGG